MSDTHWMSGKLAREARRAGQTAPDHTDKTPPRQAVPKWHQKRPAGLMLAASLVLALLIAPLALLH